MFYGGLEPDCIMTIHNGAYKKKITGKESIFTNVKALVNTSKNTYCSIDSCEKGYTGIFIPKLSTGYFTMLVENSERNKIKEITVLTSTYPN